MRARLSEHFLEAEFLSPDRDELPPGYRDELRQLCVRYLEPLRREFGPVTVHSGHRTPTWNGHVGGARRSRHMDLPRRAGAAADVSCVFGSPARWYHFLAALEPGGLGLYESHVHVDNRRGRARW